jgi:hypothetical protein
VKKIALLIAVMTASCMALAATSKADDIHLCATAAACTGNSGSLEVTTSTTAFVYGKAYNPIPDTLYVAILTPVADNSGNWNSSTGTLAQVLGENPNQTFPTLASAISALQGVGMSATSFNVTDVAVNSLNPWQTGALDTNPLSFTLPGSPSAGTIYMAFLEDANGNLVAVSPWSSSLVFAPEPGSVGLTLLGMMALAITFGRRVCKV